MWISFDPLSASCLESEELRLQASRAGSDVVVSHSADQFDAVVPQQPP